MFPLYGPENANPLGRNFQSVQASLSFAHRPPNIFDCEVNSRRYSSNALLSSGTGAPSEHAIARIVSPPIFGVLELPGLSQSKLVRAVIRYPVPSPDSRKRRTQARIVNAPSGV